VLREQCCSIGSGRGYETDVMSVVVVPGRRSKE